MADNLFLLFVSISNKRGIVITKLSFKFSYGNLYPLIIPTEFFAAATRRILDSELNVMRIITLALLR